MIIIILITKILIRKDLRKVMMKDENKDAALSLLNKRSQMATNQQSSLSLGGKHSLNLKHQHHILSTNHSMFSTEGKQHVNNLYPHTLDCLMVEGHIRQCLQDHAGNVSVWIISCQDIKGKALPHHTEYIVHVLSTSLGSLGTCLRTMEGKWVSSSIRLDSTLTTWTKHYFVKCTNAMQPTFCLADIIYQDIIAGLHEAHAQ